MKLGRWFDSAEFRCRCGRRECDALERPAPELVALLDRLRDRLDAPIVITSGLRCKWWNDHEHGEPNSGHLNGTEVDVAVPSSRYRYRLLWAVFAYGIRRVGIYPKHVHLGLDGTGLPTDVVWVGTYTQGG